MPCRWIIEGMAAHVCEGMRQRMRERVGEWERRQGRVAPSLPQFFIELHYPILHLPL